MRLQPEKFRSYLLTTARRELCAYYRGRDKEREHLDPDATSAWDLDPTPSTMVVEAEEQRLLAKALRRIPLSFQVALELFYWQELTAAEIGEVLELPEGTVRSRLRRGRELLAEQMANISTSELATQASVEDLELWARSIRDSVAK